MSNKCGYPWGRYVIATLALVGVLGSALPFVSNGGTMFAVTVVRVDDNLAVKAR